MKKILIWLRPERGQILLLGALLATVLLGMAGLAIDVGFHYAERRQLQNAADEATLAAAYEMKYGGSIGDATTAALENASANGYNNDGVTNTVTVNMPPTAGDFLGDPNAVEVVIRDLDVPTFFIHVLVPSTAQIEGRGVSVLSGGGGTGTPTEPLPVVLPNIACDDDQALVDGRVMDNESYTKVADLISTTTSVDYGDAFYACDGTYYYFALRLNGPSTGGGVANENVYGGCKDPGSPDINGNTIKKLKGMITAIGANTFTLDSNGTIWTIDVDGSTSYKGGINDFSDLTVGMAVEVKGTILGSQHVLASEVKKKSDTYCTATSDTTYHSTYNTGWDDNAHTFEKLLKSDRARFQINCDGSAVHDFVQDYLRQVGSDWVSDAAGDGEVIVAGPNQSASSLEFNLENPTVTGWGDDPGENPQEQSPPFVGVGQYPTYSSEYDGFVWEMLYEFRVPIADYSGCSQVTFGLHEFSGQAGGLEGIHSSPAKTADGAYLQVEPFDVRLVE